MHFEYFEFNSHYTKLGALEDQFKLMLDYEKRRGRGVVTRLNPSKRNKLELGGSILGYVQLRVAHN